MKPSVVSFDAAGTLIDVSWNPGLAAVEAAVLSGADLKDRAAGSFDLLVRTRWVDYLALNLTRDESRLDDFWRQLGRDWFEGMGLAYLESFETHFWNYLYGPSQTVFSLFSDVHEALEDLRRRSFRLAVLSNWDYSLHRILRMLGIFDYFELTIASLEEGPEKPDPKLFEVLLRRMEVTPDDVVHVGDNAIDDYQGARKAGMRGILIDRNQKESKPPFIGSLLELQRVL